MAKFQFCIHFIHLIMPINSHKTKIRHYKTDELWYMKQSVCDHTNMECVIALCFDSVFTSVHISTCEHFVMCNKILLRYRHVYSSFTLTTLTPSVSPIIIIIIKWELFTLSFGIISPVMSILSMIFSFKRLSKHTEEEKKAWKFYITFEANGKTSNHCVGIALNKIRCSFQKE